MHNSIKVFICLLFCALQIEAQNAHTIDISNDYQSMVVNADSTVTFCYCGPAKRVRLQANFLYAGEDSALHSDHTRQLKMHKHSDGCFHVTTKPIQPEIYTYCFRVNGRRTPDPLNPDTAWQKMHKWNVVSIGGTEQADLYCPPAWYGRMIHTTWYSAAEGLSRRVNIYLPYGYAEEAEREGIARDSVPVLFLLHGINGYEGSWSERGRATQVLENLVAQGKCGPMIVVMPDVNFGVHKDKPSHHTIWNNVFNYPRLCHKHEIEIALVELVEKVDSIYHLSGKHYIAGFSDGARMASITANLLPGYFSAIGLFSPVVHKKQLPGKGIAAPDSAYTPIYYIYTGKADMFHPNAKRIRKHMEKNNLAFAYTETSGGHTWHNWRIYLSDFLTRISGL